MVFSAPLKTGSLQYNITKEELPAIEWLKNNTPEDSLVLAMPYISKPIKVLANRGVVCTNPTRFGCSASESYRVSSFFFYSCEDKKAVLDSTYFPDYVLEQKSLKAGEKTVEFPIDGCDFFEKVFEHNNIIIYKNKTNN